MSAKWALRRKWYRWRYGIRVPPSMLPKLGKGRFVDVERRGPCIDITDHDEQGTIRLIPYQPNHGVMVEFWDKGRVRWRTPLDYRALRGMGIGESAAAPANQTETT